MRKKRNLKERVCALVLALLLPLTSVLPDVTMVASAADPVNPSSTTVQNVSFYIYEDFTVSGGATQEVGLSGAKITISDGAQIVGEGTTEKGGTFTLSGFNVDSAKTYTYSVEKDGFNSETDITLKLDDTNKQKLTMSPIDLSETAIGPLNPADSNNNTAAIDITNRIENSSDGEPGYVWESDKEAVATVDQEGNVTAVSLGEANITVSRHNETASVKVIVKEAITGMTISATPVGGTIDNVDVSSVEISVGGMPQDASGVVKIYKNDENTTSIGTIAAPYNSKVTYSSPAGTTKFIAVFEENTNDFYLKSSVSTNEISYKKSSQIVLNQASDTVTYGNTPKQIIVTPASLQGRTLSYVSSNENVATVEKNGSVSSKSAGTATITVTAAANDEYTESTAKYDITVDQRTLSNISLQNISWQPVEKVYDGKTEITMKGKLSHTENADIVGDDVIEVEATAELDSADAKSYTTCNITKITKSSDTRYQFNIDDTNKEVSSQIEITKRPVYVSIEKKTGDYETTIPYGKTKDEILTKVKADNKVVLAGTNGKIVDGAEQGLVGTDKLDKLKEDTEIILKDQNYYVGTYEDAIQPKIKNTDAGNYEICMVDDNKYYGRLQITKEVKTDDEIRNAVSVNSDAEGVYKEIKNANTPDDYNIWVRGNAEGLLTFAIKDDTYYNCVAVSQDGGKSWVKFPDEKGIQFSDDKDAEKELDIYLKDSRDNKDDNTRTTNKDGKDNKYLVKVDAESPKAEFIGVNAGLFGNTQVPFTEFTNKSHPVTVNVSDEGSGVASFETCVIHVTEDSNIVSGIVSAKNDPSVWNNHGNAVQATENIDSKGNHIVLARIRDHVGNEAIYTSNGLVFETNAPKVNVIVNNGQPIGEVPCDSTVPYKIEIQDLESVTDITSGIEEIRVDVTDNGNTVRNSTGLDADKKVVDSYTITSDDIDKIIGAENDDKTTLSYLVKRANFAVDGILTVKKYHTNHVTISVTAVDKAGNDYTYTEENLCLDHILPEVSVGYSENKAQSKHYFESREMTIKYKERNFDESLLSFDVQVNGTDQAGTAEESRLTLDEVNALGAIQVTKISDSNGAVTNPDDYTDDREITYKVQFTEDGAYKVIPHIQDTAGNINKEVKYEVPETEDYDGNELFIIDSKIPEVQVSYDSYKDSLYYNSRVMKIDYKERNFDESLLTFELEVNGKKIEGSAEKSRLTLEELRKMKEFKVGALVDSEANIEETAHTENRLLSYEIQFQTDGCYKLIPHIKDKAGKEDSGVTYSQASASNETFYVDDKAPTIKAIYNDKEIGVKNGHYFKAPRTMTVVITERNFSLENTSFHVKVDGKEQVCTYAELKDITGINAVTVVEDSEADVDSRMHTDDREIKFTLTFGTDEKGRTEDHDYLLTVSTSDLTGNSSGDVKDENQLVKTGELFTVDTVAPVMSVEYYSYNDQKERINITQDINTAKRYKKYNIEAEVTIAERNFADGEKFQNMNVSETAVDLKNESVSVSEDRNSLAKAVNKWNSGLNRGEHTQTFIFPDEANYTFNMAYTDLAGNSAVLVDESNQEKGDSFTVDKTAPEGTVTISEDEGVFRKILDTITFGIFRNHSVTVTMNSKDVISPYVQRYYIDNPDPSQRNLNMENGEFDALTEDELNHIDQWTRLDNDLGEAPNYTVDEKQQTYQLNENSKAVPYVFLEDQAGNRTYINSKGIIDDRESPSSPEIIITTEDPVAEDQDTGLEIFKGDVNFNIKVTDPIPEGSDTYSGLAKVSYKIIKDGNADKPTQSGNFNEELKPAEKRVQTLEKTDLLIQSDKNNSNDIVIEVTAEDNAGNITVATRELAIDITKPQIKVSYDNNDVHNESYFTDERLMTITYQERNFYEKGLTFDLTLDGKAMKGISLEELKAVDGISVKGGPIDSQNDVPFKKLSDKRTVEYQILFGEGDKRDADYVIVPHIADAATYSDEGAVYEKGTKAKEKFTVDKVAPEIKVVYKAGKTEVSPGKVNADRIYESSVITAEVTVTERNFSLASKFSEEPKQMDLTFKATDFKKVGVDTEDFTASADTRGKWTSDGYVRTQVFSFTVDANYELALTYKDLAGNEVVYGTHYFTVDTLEPTGRIVVDDKNIWEKFAHWLTFGIFTQNTKTITMTSEDLTSGVKSMQYYKDIPDVETRGTFAALTWDELDQIKDWTDGSETQVTANEQAIIYMKMVDMAGNVTYINSETGIIADNQKPSAPEITITMADPPQGIYGGDVPFSIDVTDPAVGGTYSGLKEVSYEVTSNGQRTQEGIQNWEKAFDRQQSYHADLKVEAEQNNTNHVTIKVVAIDYAGNQSEATKDIKIDTTPPEVQIEYNLNNPSNGKYYNATRTATVSVRERNFDPDAVDFTITNTDGTMPSISGWSISPSAGETDDAVNTCTVTFAADGDYTITMNCTDRAGNRSHYTQVDEFTIDQTVPTINVTFDNNNAANGTYYDKPRTATVTVNEHNFNGSEVQAAISASLKSQGISAPGVNGWSTSGDSHSATIYFGTDGDYSFTVNYTDLAGNPATAYTQDKFTVDQTKPEIDIFDITDKSANNGTVAPGVKYSDVNYDASAVKISIKGPKHSEKTISGSRSSIPNGESIKMADFEHKESVDDVYTLTAQVSDLAGNTDEKSVTFSVNRFGSNFIFGTSTEAFLDQYYSNKEQDLVVTEVNVDTLVHNGISYGLDGELVNLTKGTDYTVKESGNEASWKSYEYTIKAANFEKEGLYNVTIDSKDRAKNEVNNKVKEANIEFVIDKTKPTVVITGVEDDGQYRTNNRDITIAVADNVAMDRLDVQVDGTDSQSRSYDAKEIQKQKGEIPFSLASSSNWQEIKAAAVDAAGNTAETSELRVLITANLLVQFYRNTPLVVGSSVGLAAIAAALAVFLSKKKKSNQKQA